MDKITKALERARANRDADEPLLIESDIDFTPNSNMPLQWSSSQPSITHFTPDALTLEKNRILNSASREEMVQPYKVLRTRLMQILQEKGWSSIAVLSPTKDDGKTTVAINLAISIGNSMQSSAVLLDLDLLTPSVYSCFGYQPTHGLEDYFENEVPLNDILVCPDMHGLAIAPAVRPLRNSSEYLTTSKGSDLITEAKSLALNSVVIVDLPPILVSDDAISFLPHIDAVLLVVREGKTNKVDIERAQEMLTNANIAGVVINDSAEPATLGYY